MKRKRSAKKKSPLESAWTVEKWIDRCAWCAKPIPEDVEVFGISISLKPEAFQEIDRGTVQPLLLMQAGKTVPMMVVSDDSPTRHAGKDAVFQLCSDTCAKALQSALKQELGS